jgi:hypothetical protein
MVPAGLPPWALSGCLLAERLKEHSQQGLSHRVARPVSFSSKSEGGMRAPDDNPAMPVTAYPRRSMGIVELNPFRG